MLLATDDSGTFPPYHDRLAGALCERVELISADGQTYFALFTFGSIARTIFSVPINAETKPLVLAAIKTLPVPEQRFTDPAEAVKAFQRELGSIFFRFPRLQDAWHDGNVGLTAILVWDGQTHLDPKSRSSTGEFKQIVKAFHETYHVPVTNIVVTAHPPGSTNQAALTSAYMNESPVSRADLRASLANIHEVSRPVPVVPASIEPAVPGWLWGIDFTSGLLLMGLGISSWRSRRQARRKVEREETRERFVGSWNYGCGSDLGTFILNERAYARFGQGGDYLRRLASTFLIQLGSRGAAEILVESGHLVVDGRRLRRGSKAEIGARCLIECTDDKGKIVRIELKHLDRHPRATLGVA